MSRDSSRHYIHLHSPHHADLFETFSTLSTSSTNPHDPSSSFSSFHDQQHHNRHPHHPPGVTNIPFTPSTLSTPQLLAPTPLGNAPASSMGGLGAAGMGFEAEDILIPVHLLPPNPEDEDEVVPDMHAAFGISRALGLNGDGRGGSGGGGGGGDRDGRAGRRDANGEERWRDFEGLRERVRGLELLERENVVNGVGGSGGRMVGLGGGSAEGRGGSAVARAREGGR